MTLQAARRLLATFQGRELTKAERQKVLNLRATIRRLTGNHFAV